MSKQKTAFIKTKEFWISVVGVLLFAIFWFSTIPSPYKKDFITKLYNSYSENAAACKEKYDGKDVSFKCKVRSISSSSDYIHVISVNSDDDLPSLELTCRLDSEELKNKALKLKKGDKIKIKGTLTYDNYFGEFELETESISKLLF